MGPCELDPLLYMLPTRGTSGRLPSPGCFCFIWEGRQENLRDKHVDEASQVLRLEEDSKEAILPAAGRIRAWIICLHAAQDGREAVTGGDDVVLRGQTRRRHTACNDTGWLKGCHTMGKG